MSARRFSDDAPSIGIVENLIQMAVGTQRCPRLAQAGRVSSTDIVVARTTSDLAYRYDFDGGVLAELTVSAGRVFESADQADVASAPVLLLLGVRPERRPQYRNAYDLALIEVGQVYQSLEIEASTSGLGVCALGAVTAEVRELSPPINPVLAVVIGEPEGDPC